LPPVLDERVTELLTEPLFEVVTDVDAANAGAAVNRMVAIAAAAVSVRFIGM
jgi:hypothetical protein